MSNTQISEKESKVAQKVQEDAVLAVHTVMKALTLSQTHYFPDNPLTLPILHLTAICHYINQYIETFPAEIKQNVIDLAYESLGFSVDSIEGDNDLFDMKTVGTA
jgi:hypothetical protein